MTERIWIILSLLLLIAAAVFLWQNNLSAAFVIAALGAVAWFLSYRAQLRAKNAETEKAGEQPNSEESDED